MVNIRASLAAAREIGVIDDADHDALVSLAKRRFFPERTYANLIDDGTRLWLIDWDYAGFNSPLFDLGGVASNNGLDEAQTLALLEAYHGSVDHDLLRRFSAMRCASLLRETLWSMVSEIHSTLDFDYAAYTATNLQRAEAAWQDHKRHYG
jgi:thiamine kinase-like enzyme